MDQEEQNRVGPGDSRGFKLNALPWEADSAPEMGGFASLFHEKQAQLVMLSPVPFWKQNFQTGNAASAWSTQEQKVCDQLCSIWQRCKGFVTKPVSQLSKLQLPSYAICQETYMLNCI